MLTNKKSEDKIEYLSKYKLASSFWTKGRLTALGVLLVLSGTGILIMGNHQAAFVPGQLTNAHSLFANDCAQCHQRAWRSVADAACQICHDGPVHHTNQAFTPQCTACHAEHRGQHGILTRVAARSCTQCHTDLQRNAKVPPQFVSRIQSFGRGHPEFAVTVWGKNGTAPARVRLGNTAALVDTAQIKLNHAAHLRSNIPGPRGFEQLTCESCHRVDAQGEHMLPIEYETHCMRCHSLEFDPRFPEQSVPHDSPGEIRTFLVGTFTQYYLDSTRESDAEKHKPLRRRPGRPASSDVPPPLMQRITWGVHEAERFLFEETRCQGCHILKRTSDTQLPTIEKPAIPQRWLPYSVFNHRAHLRAGLSCEHCHRTAPSSQQTSDVLLPGIAVCQECHSVSGGVGFACMSCHQYHGRDRGTLMQ